MGYCGTHRVVLVGWNYLRIHGILHIGEVPGSHDAGGDVAHGVDDAESGADQDIHGVVDQDIHGVAGAGDDIDDEDEDQNHGK